MISHEERMRKLRAGNKWLSEVLERIAKMPPKQTATLSAFGQCAWVMADGNIREVPIDQILIVPSKETTKLKESLNAAQKEADEEYQQWLSLHEQAPEYFTPQSAGRPEWCKTMTADELTKMDELAGRIRHHRGAAKEYLDFTSQWREKP